MEIGEGTIDLCALSDLEETQEFRNATEINNELEAVRSSRKLKWADDIGGNLFEVIEFEKDNRCRV